MGSRQNVILILILLIAGLARFLGQNMSPPSLYWEETALGYDAYSLLKTGKDHHGNPWPIVAFESFGDWKPSGYYYALLPSLRIFGLTDLAVRLPSMVAGILTVYLIYLITLEATSKKDLALWSAAALAISPWHIHFSRAAFEVNLATFWLTLGIFGLIKGKKNAMYLGLSAFSWAASIYTYHGLRVLAPLMIVSLLWIWKKELRKQKWLGLCLLTGVLLVWPIISALNTPQIQQRINETSLFSTSQAVITQNQWRQDDRWSIISRIVHHRYWLWAEEMIKGGLNHL